MKQLTLLANVAALLCALVAPGLAESTTDRSIILAIHQKILKAHLDGNASLMLEDAAEDYIAVGRGEVRYPTLREREERLGPYLRTTTFTEYRDLIEPVVRISDDGTSAWLVAQVEATGTQVSSDVTLPISFVSAWIELYEKRGEAWVQVGNVSNFRE